MNVITWALIIEQLLTNCKDITEVARSLLLLIALHEGFQAAGSGDTTPPLQPGEDKSFPRRLVAAP